MAQSQCGRTQQSADRDGLGREVGSSGHGLAPWWPRKASLRMTRNGFLGATGGIGTVTDGSISVQPWLHMTKQDELMPIGEWVLFAYRLPREPSTPRIALWRALRRLGVVQLLDGLVALPADSRTREQMEWLADGVLEGGAKRACGSPGPARLRRSARWRGGCERRCRWSTGPSWRMRRLPLGLHRERASGRWGG